MGGDAAAGVGDFLQPQKISLAHRALGPWPVILPGAPDFEHQRREEIFFSLPARWCKSSANFALNEFVGYLDLTRLAKELARDPRKLHGCDLRAVRFREFFQHRDASRRYRLTGAGTPQRNGASRLPRDDRRVAGGLHDGVPRGIFALSGRCFRIITATRNARPPLPPRRGS